MTSVNRLAAATMLAAVLLPAAAGAQPAEGTDRALEARIEARIKASPLLRQDRIDVAVQGAVVTLSGRVSAASHGERAAALAKVPGVARVDNRLEVDPRVGARRGPEGPRKRAGDRTKQAAGQVAGSVTDVWIVAKLNADFVGEDLLKGSDINVDSSRHIVTLKGTVPSAAARARAVHMAKTTKGVAQVVDALAVAAAR